MRIDASCEVVVLVLNLERPFIKQSRAPGAPVCNVANTGSLFLWCSGCTYVYVLCTHNIADVCICRVYVLCIVYTGYVCMPYVF